MVGLSVAENQKPEHQQLTEEQLRRRRNRSIALAIALAALVVIMVAITLIRGPESLVRPI